VVPRPPAGYCFSSTLCAWNLESCLVKVVWDGGAEATSISDRCLSRIMRAQKSLSNGQCPCVKQGRIDPPQCFSTSH
jgi:hypothetical protein